MSNTDTSAADNGQLAGIFAHLQANQAAEQARAARMKAIVDEMSPETRNRVAERLDTRFHEITGTPTAEQGDPQWAGPSLPHPSEATSEQEYDDLQEGWDNWAKGIDPNQIHEGHYDSEALEA
jgi:hypothetical protein